MNRRRVAGIVAIALSFALPAVAASCASGDGGADDAVAGTDTRPPQDLPPDRGDDAWIDDEAPADVPVVVPNPDGKAHGEPCTADAECRYLRCIAAPSITGGTFRICTKDCSSGSGTGCSVDGADVTCARFSASSGDDLASFCVPTCSSVDGCPDGYTACSAVGAALKVCNAVP